MKATGIVRRIDDLGRIIIPKEIRRTLRLHEGDSMEIFINGEGEVIFKKYSDVESIQDHANSCASALFETVGHPVYITDRDRVVSICGYPKKNYLNKEIDSKIVEVIEKRKERFITEFDPENNYFTRIIVPILMSGDIVGTVVVFSKEEGVVMGELELKLAQMSAKYLGKLLEND